MGVRGLLKLARLLTVFRKEAEHIEHNRGFKMVKGSLAAENAVLSQRVRRPSGISNNSFEMVKFSEARGSSQDMGVRRNRDGQLEVILNDVCCEKLPEAMIDEMKEPERVWLISKSGQVESLVEKNVLKEGIWVLELSGDLWTARIIVRNGVISDVRLGRASTVYQGKAAIAMINDMTGPAELRVYKLKDKVIEGDPLSNLLLRRRTKKASEILDLRMEVVEEVNRIYESLTESNDYEVCKGFARLQGSMEKLFFMEERMLNKSRSKGDTLSSHKFEHAIILRGISNLAELLCNREISNEMALVKFLRIVEDIKVHFIQRDVEIYRMI